MELTEILDRGMRTAARKRGLTVSQLATLAQQFAPTVSRQTLLHWRTAKNPPNTETIKAVCSALKIDVRELILIGLGEAKSLNRDSILVSMRRVQDAVDELRQVVENSQG